MSDIKFSTSDEVIVEAFSLKLEGADLKLDHAPRRTNTSAHRRALVHDYNDGLTINWSEDYPGGITLRGDVKVAKISGSHLRVHHHDIHLDHPARRISNAGSRRALVHDFNDGLTINWNSDYPHGVTIRGAVKCPNSLSVGGQDIMTLLSNMQSRIQALEDRVAALEGGA